MNKPILVNLEKLSKMKEPERRTTLRPHDEAGLNPGANEEDKDAVEIRAALDKELAQLTEMELDRESGGEPNLAFLDDYKCLLLESPAFSHYLTSYSYFGVRFALGRSYCYCQGPDEERDCKCPSDDGVKKRRRIWNERTVPLKPPDPVEACNGREAFEAFRPLSQPDDPRWEISLQFLDGFTIWGERSLESPADPDVAVTSRTFELYLRGLWPPKDSKQALILSELRSGLIQWAEERCKFYRSLETKNDASAGSTEGTPCEGGSPAPKQRNKTHATNPLAARFGVADLYWLSRILGASISSQCQVSYVGVSWLELIARQGEGTQQTFTCLEMEEILRNVFDFACELIQNSIEISQRCEWRKALPADQPDMPTDSWRLTFDRELNEIHCQRKLRNYQRPPDPTQAQPRAESAKTPCGEDDVQEYYWSRRIRTGESEQDLVGIALSGGGIRSATFSLGVLERLREIDLLRELDYLSTVSGGGYIGAWLLGNVRRTRYWLGKFTSWKESIDHLRDYSDYLAPRSGVFSADPWVIWGTWIRNTLLIQLLAVVCLSFILALALLGKRLFDLPGNSASANSIAHMLVAVCAVGIVVPVCWQLFSFGSATGEKTPKVLSFFAWVSAFASAALLWQVAGDLTRTRGLVDFSAFFLLFWRAMPLYMGVSIYACFVAISTVSLWPDPEKQWTMQRVAGVLFTPLPCLVVEYVSLCGILWFFNRLADQGNPQGSWMSYVLGPPLTLMAFTLSVVMFIGVIGKSTADWRREWWTRYGTWLTILAVIFFASSLAAVFGPLSLIELSRFHPGLTWGGIASFAGTVGGALLAGQSSRTNGDANNGSSAALQWFARIGALVFIVGGVLGVATCLYEVLALNLDHTYEDYWTNLNLISTSNALLAVLGILFAAALLFGSRFDLNVFGLNQFYRNRLVRCYLGATRWRPGVRRPNGFTGFDEGDDLLMTDLRYDCDKWDGEKFRGPFPLVNCALNLGGSSDLQVKTRRSASFTLTPLTRGADRPRLGYLLHPQSESLTLGQAISISGAAASPNRGYNTSPLVSFLLTLFNVRLGWWFPNPGRLDQPAQWTRRFNFNFLFQELFGLADESSALVNLSDGGHFENLGIYELVRRRAKVIIACDGEADPDLTFGSLGNLIRICKTDFGAEIDLDVGSIRSDKESGLSRAHCAVGKINYASGRQGYLIYLKASVTGDEDIGVEQYRAGNPTFPHETTLDQFFSEDQFEAYRRLGHHVAQMTFRSAEYEQTPVEIASALYDRWTAQSSPVANLVQHGNEFNTLWEVLRKEPKLDMLFKELTADAPTAPAIPPSEQELAACMELIQLMENVFLSLRLNETWSHPDNRGWAVLFTMWAKSPRFRGAWSRSRKTYGIRFERFCDERLGL